MKNNNIILSRIEPYLKEVLNDVRELSCSSSFPEIVDNPKGVRQDHDGDKELFDHIYIDQHRGSCDDDYYGSAYYPFFGKYLKVGYWF